MPAVVASRVVCNKNAGPVVSIDVCDGGELCSVKVVPRVTTNVISTFGIAQLIDCSTAAVTHSRKHKEMIAAFWRDSSALGGNFCNVRIFVCAKWVRILLKIF